MNGPAGAPDLSIIIVNWNTRDYLRECLRSIEETPPPLAHEVIVVDNHSSDGSAEMVRTEFPAVRLLASRVNAGFARGNNLGYAMARGRAIAIVNPDTIIRPGAFERCIAHLEAHPSVGVVAGKFLNPDGSLQRQHYRRFPSLAAVFFCLTPLGAVLDRALFKRRFERCYFYSEKDFDEAEPIDQPGATFMVMPRRVIEAIGLFDENFPIFFNDVDLCKRIWDSGREIHRLPEAVVIHYGGQGVKQLGWKGYRFTFTGCVRYMRKHHGVGRAAAAAGILAANAVPLVAVLLASLAAAFLRTARERGIREAARRTVRFFRSW